MDAEAPERHDAGSGLRRFGLMLAMGLASLGVVSPAPSYADVDFFLYRTGTVLFLSQADPTNSLPTFTASPGISFWFGNPWADVGSWGEPFSPADFVIVDSASDLHVWLGLRNSDDIGAAVDLRAEVWVKGVGSDPVLVAQGLVRCITGLTRDPSRAKEIIVPFISTASTFASGTEAVLLKLLVRVGTTDDDKRCSGRGASHAAASGVRAYHGGIGAPSSFGLSIAIP